MRLKTSRVLGFTLIELLIVVSVISILLLLVLTTLNPITQIKKGQDAKREQDLRQIVTALDTYYNDKNYYPTNLTSSLSSGTTVYMKNIPKDPAAASGWKDYAYVIDDASPKPQWNVLLAKVAIKITSDTQASTLCPLRKICSGFPNVLVASYTGYNYCVVSGNIDSAACLKIVIYVNSHL